MDPKGRILKETPRFSYEDMMAIVEPGERVIHGYRVKTNSLRYRTFKKQRACVCCGIKGSFFQLHKSNQFNEAPDRAHFNFWAVLPDGNLRLMTKDHIKPKSRGGKDCIENMQTMCYECNQQKGARSVERRVQDLLTDLRHTEAEVRRRVLRNLQKMVDQDE